MLDSRTKTYRSAFCRRAIVPKLLPDLAHDKARVLDFGCGEDAYWVKYYQALGWDIEGCDLSRPDMKPTGKFDVVMLSNVLNVQRSKDQIEELVRKILPFDPEAVLYNYPQSPRKFHYGENGKNIVRQYFEELFGENFSSKKIRQNVYWLYRVKSSA